MGVMRVGLISLAMLVLGYSSGFFYGRSLPQIIHFKRDAQLQEIRDDYFRKCETTSAVVRQSGVIEEKWSCPKIKVFLIKKYTERTFEKEVFTNKK